MGLEYGRVVWLFGLKIVEILSLPIGANNDIMLDLEKKNR